MGLDRYRILFDLAPLCVHEIDADGRLIAMNPAGLAMMGVASEDAIRGRDYLTLVGRSDRDRVRRLMANAFAGQACAFEFCAAASVALARAQGAPATARPRHFTSCFIPSPGAHGHIDRLIGISQDISPHPEAEAELRRLNRAHAVLARCNRSLARAMGERGLLNAFCTNLVEVGGYCFAWVGYAGRKHPPRVRMVAHAGQEHADFIAEALAWANTGDRPSACRMAVESGRPVVLRDIANEPDLAPWADTALCYGYRSMIALPLRAEGTR